MFEVILPTLAGAYVLNSTVHVLEENRGLVTYALPWGITLAVIYELIFDIV